MSEATLKQLLTLAAIALAVFGYLYMTSRDDVRQVRAELKAQEQKVEELQASVSSLHRSADSLCNTLWGFWRRQGEPSPSELENYLLETCDPIQNPVPPPRDIYSP